MKHITFFELGPDKELGDEELDIYRLCWTYRGWFPDDNKLDDAIEDELEVERDGKREELEVLEYQPLFPHSKELSDAHSSSSSSSNVYVYIE